MSDRFGTSPLWHPCHFESPLACRGRSSVLPSQVRHLLCHDDHKGSDRTRGTCTELFLWWSHSGCFPTCRVETPGKVTMVRSSRFVALLPFAVGCFILILFNFLCFIWIGGSPKKLLHIKWSFDPADFLPSTFWWYSIHFINLLCFHFLWQQNDSNDNDDKDDNNDMSLDSNHCVVIESSIAFLPNGDAAMPQCLISFLHGVEQSPRDPRSCRENVLNWRYEFWVMGYEYDLWHFENIEI